MVKAVTLLGMSGAGKTHFSQVLAGWGWVHYSNDFEIAKRLGVPVSVDDLSALSSFVGQLGDEALGGLPMEEFKRRQQLYYEAECAVLKDLPDEDGKLVNDSTGSFCEITDDDLIARVAHKSLFVYIESDLADHDAIIKRAQEYPKPLFFPPALLSAWVEEYCDETGVSVAQIVPDDFSAWVFPRLFQSRLPKYERLAARYGVRVAAKDLHGCESEAAFLDLIQAAKP